jgi:hypothetical protein
VSARECGAAFFFLPRVTGLSGGVDGCGRGRAVGDRVQIRQVRGSLGGTWPVGVWEAGVWAHGSRARCDLEGRWSDYCCFVCVISNAFVEQFDFYDGQFS